MPGPQIVFGEAHLRRILGAYAVYYNESRIHRSLNKDAPFHRATEPVCTKNLHPDVVVMKSAKDRV